MHEITPQEDYVISTVKSRDVHFIRCWFVDVLGNPKSLAIVPNELERAFDIGIPLNGNYVAGFESETETDIIAWPEASTFQVLPWRPDEKCVARMFCTLKTPDGAPFASDSRNILSNTLKAASNSGYLANIKPEIQFYYFKSKEDPTPLDRGSSFDLTSLDSASDLRRDTVLTLESVGIPVQYSHHELGNSQNEIELRTTDAMSMADSVLTYKLAVKEIATKHGVYASFMPKPLDEQPGNSMHLYIHLTDDEGKSVFCEDENGENCTLSVKAKSFVAGILKYAPEFCLITNQYTNSYKRIAENDCCGNYIAWSKTNKNTIIRVTGYRPNTEEGTRIELRMPDPACNPYLAFAAIISCGLKGIEENLSAPDMIEDNEELKEKSQHLPRTLGEALAHFEKSALMEEVLGSRVFNYIKEEKAREWSDEIKRVSKTEIDRYLAVL